MTIGQSVLLDGSQTGVVTNASRASIFGVALSSALTGSLTLTGVSNTDGTAATWTINSGTSGYVAAPGSKTSWGPLGYTLSSSSDLGKAIVAFQPL